LAAIDDRKDCAHLHRYGLHLLVSRAGHVLSKTLLIREAWQDVSVTDNNLVQVVRQLRQVLDPGDMPTATSSEACRDFAYSVGKLAIAGRATRSVTSE
jgi:DNA-binding response OmpR family regulator